MGEFGGYFISLNVVLVIAVWALVRVWLLWLCVCCLWLLCGYVFVRYLICAWIAFILGGWVCLLFGWLFTLCWLGILVGVVCG